MYHAHPASYIDALTSAARNHDLDPNDLHDLCSGLLRTIHDALPDIHEFADARDALQRYIEARARCLVTDDLEAEIAALLVRLPRLAGVYCFECVFDRLAAMVALFEANTAAWPSGRAGGLETSFGELRDLHDGILAVRDDPADDERWRRLIVLLPHLWE